MLSDFDVTLERTNVKNNYGTYQDKMNTIAKKIIKLTTGLQRGYTRLYSLVS